LTALRLAAVAAAAALFASVVAAADVGRVASLLGAVGFLGLVVVLLPQPIALLIEAIGWKLAVRVLGRDVGLAPLLRVRVATEALSLSLPAGVLLGESAKALLLGRHCGLSVNEGVAAIVARKYLLLVSQAAFVVLVATLGFGILRGASLGVLGSPGLEWLAYAPGVVLLAAACGTAAWLRRSAVAAGLFQALRKVPLRSLSRWLDATEERFSATDESVSVFFRSGFGRHAVPACWFALG
jgi:hypothetical protein